MQEYRLDDDGEGEGGTVEDTSFRQLHSRAAIHSGRLTLVSSPAEATIESKLLISGKVTGRDPGESIRINGVPASVLDAAGNFFDLQQLGPGENLFELTVDGQQPAELARQFRVQGVSEDTASVDFSSLTPAVSRGIQARYGTSSFRERDQRLLVDITFTNQGTFPVSGPLLVAITDLNHPLVRPVETDGVTPAGVSFLNLDVNGSSIAMSVGQSLPTRLLQFSNPQRQPFTYDLEIFGILNRPPRFTSLPIVDVLAGGDYDYPVTAYDAEQEKLQFSLLSGPASMKLDQHSGELSWRPSQFDVGTHTIVLEVQDPSGAKDLQTFVISVTDAMPNRPPIWTSTPPTEAFVNQRYVYSALAIDADEDLVTYELESGPIGLELSETTGRLVWERPQADQLGSHWITLLARDPAGAVARHTFEVLVLPQPGNHPPIIVTEPRTYFESSGSTSGVPQGDVQPRAIRLALQADQTETQTVSLRLSPDTIKSDIFLLFDDTESFEPYAPTLKTGFPQVVLALQREFPGIDFAFGVGRFEEYANFALESTSGRPFILNQPIIETDVPNFSRALLAALSRDALGNGGDGPESLIEALYQVATGSGFDGNADGDTSDSGAAGAWFTQTQPGPSGDVPAFDSFQPDPTRWILPPSGTLGGAGFRFGAIPIILAATDAGTAYEPDFVDPLVGAAGVTVPLSRFQGFPYPIGRSFRASTPDGRGAGIQETVDALKQLGALVVGVGAGLEGEVIRRELAMRAEHDPRRMLEAIAQLTGAINQSPNTLAGNIEAHVDPQTGQFAAADPIEPGDPLYFVLEMPQVEPVPESSTRSVQTALLNGSHPVDLYVLEGLVGTSGRLQITSVTEPRFGRATISQGTDYITYSPHGSFVSDSFEVEVLLDQETGFRHWYPVTIERSILPPMGLPDPMPPLARDDSWSLRDIQPGHPLQLLVLNNDQEDNGDTVRITHVTQPAHGTVAIATSGDYVIYTPNGNTLQPDQFSYTVTDQDGSASARVKLSLDQPVQPPLLGFAKNIVDTVTATLRASRFELELIADNPIATNLTGIVSGVGLDQSASFDVAFQGDGASHQFDLRIVRAGSGLVLGSIPVIISAGYQYRVDAIDPDNDPITYALIEAPEGATWNSETQRIDWIPEAAGTYSFTLQARDGRGGVDTQHFTVEVGPRTDNQPPQLDNSPAPAMAEPGRLYQFQVQATDPDGDPLRYWLINAPPGMSIDRDAGRITWTPSRTDLESDLTARQHAFRVRVTDPSGQADELEYELTVQPIIPNTSPEIVSNPLKAAEQGETYRYVATAQDPNADILNWDLVVHPIGMTVSAPSGVVVWKPTARDVGRHDVILRVQDGQGGVDLQTWQINVVEENYPPLIVSRFASGPAVVGRRLQQSITAIDPNGDELFYSVDDRGRELGVEIDTNSGLLQWIPREDQRGQTLEFSVQVSDGRLSNEQEVNLVVSSDWTNDPPELLSQPRQRIRAQQTWLYPVLAHDPNGDPLRFSALGDVPEGMTWNGHVLSWTPTLADLGGRSLTVRVDDGAGGIAEQTFELDVVGRHSNSAPSFTAIPATNATVDRLYSVEVAAIDPDQDPLEFRLIQAPTGMMLDSQSGSLYWKPTLEQLGAQAVEIEVADPFGSTAVQSFVVMTRAVNLPPILTSIPKTIGKAERLYAYDVRATDPEGALLTWSLVAVDSMGRTVTGPTIDSRGSIRWVPRADQVGTYQLTAIARDPVLASTSQTWTLVVSADGTSVDQPPVITSSPPSYATVGEQLVYTVQGFDPDDQAITYSLTEAPDDPQASSADRMSIDPISGLLRWSPPVARVGQSVPITVRATSGQLWAEQRFNMLVLPVNQEPVFASIPPDSVVAGRRYAYDIKVEDADRDRIQYRMENAPQGMTIDAFGRIRWLTTPADVGAYTFLIHASDSRGSSDPVQTVNLQVLADVEPPRGSIQMAPSPARAGQTVELFVGAVDNVAVTDLTVTLAGQAIPLDDRGWGRIAGRSPGVYDVQATFRDASGNVGTADAKLVVASEDPSAPQVFLSEAWAGNPVLLEPTQILGSVLDAGGDLAWYQLEVLTLSGEPIRTLSRVDGAPLANREGVSLGTLDPTLLLNGSYRLRLSADDLDPQNGGPVAAEWTFNVQGKLKLGNFAVTFKDMTIAVAGIPISVTRTYDSLLSHQSSDFGYGWRMELEDTDLQVDFPPGALSMFGGFPTFRDGTRVTVTRPDGSTEGFTFRPRKEVRSLGLVTVWYPRFVPDPGVDSILRVPETSLTQVYGDEYISWGAGGIGYNPANPVFGGRYEYLTLDGYKRVLDATSGDVHSIEDRRGNQITFERNQIVSNRGRAIQIERDPQGRIRAIRDPRGHQITYQYDSLGNLKAVTDRVGNAADRPSQPTMRFHYDEHQPHLLSEILDTAGLTIARVRYDNQGRMIGLYDGAGNETTFQFQSSLHQATILDPLGNATTVIHDASGNPIREISPSGQVTVREYDRQERLVRETPPDGTSRLFEYDEDGNVRVERDETGQELRYTYNAAGQPLSVTDSHGNTTRYFYDGATERGLDWLPGGLLRMVVDPNQQAVLFDYSNQGLVTSMTQHLRFDTSLYYQAMVASSWETANDACHHGGDQVCPQAGRKTTLEYSATGDIVSITDSDENMRSIAYDENGNRTTAIMNWIDPSSPGSSVKQLKTQFIFDANDQSLQTIGDTGTSRRSFDGRQLVIEEVDSFGRRSITTREARGLVLETRTRVEPNDSNPAQSIDWVLVRNIYDASGRLRYTTDPYPEATPTSEITGTHFVYDAEGRVVETLRLGGVEIRLVQDATGNRTTLMSQPRTLSSEKTLYNPIGYAVETVDADGRKTINRYLNGGQLVESRIQTRNQQGQPTWLVNRFVYDSAQRVVLYTDAYEDPGTSDGASSPESPPVAAMRPIHDAQGRVVKLQRLEGVVVKVTQASEQTVNSTVVAWGNPVWTRETHYSASGEVIRVVAEDGQITDHEYDLAGRRVASLGHAVRPAEVGLQPPVPTATWVRLRSEIEYDRHGRVEAERTNLFRWLDEKGKAIPVPQPGATELALDDRSQERTVRHQYDAHGNVVRTTFADGSYQLFRYNVQGRLLAETTPIRRQIAAAWSESQQSFVEIGDQGQEGDVVPTTLFSYTPVGLLASVELPAVLPSLNSTTPIRPRYDYAYDALGNRTLLRDPLGRETRWTYDLAGRVLSRTLPLGFGPDGKAGTSDDAFRTEPFTEQFAYDEYGRPVKHVSFEGIVTVSRYDRASGDRFGTGALLEQRFYRSVHDYADGNGSPMEMWAFGYDAFGRQVWMEQQSSAGNHQVTQEHDGEGRLKQITSPQGTVQYEYDDVGRRSAVRLYASEESDAYRDAIRNIEYTYDSLGRLQQVSEERQFPAGASSSETTQYRYDPAGNIRQEWTPSGVSKIHSYDALNRLVATSYHANSDRNTSLPSQSPLAQFEYELRADGKRVSTRERFWLDSDQNPQTEAEAHTSLWSWDYDAAGRLIRENVDHFDDRLDQSEGYQFDLNGNRTQRTVDRWNPEAVDEFFLYEYDANDRLFTETRSLHESDSEASPTLVSTTRYSYDATQLIGKQIQESGQSRPTKQDEYTYNPQGQLASVTQERRLATGEAVKTRFRYAYDATGSRIRASEETATGGAGDASAWQSVGETGYLIDPQSLTGFSQVLRETISAPDGRPVQTRDYAYGWDEIGQTVVDWNTATGAVESTVRSEFGHDSKGNVRFLTSPTGSIEQVYSYDAYGMLAGIHDGQGGWGGNNIQDARTSRLYSGEQTDRGTGLQYLRARYYDPATGRFNRLDPFTGNAMAPQSWHKYQYAHADPINGIDPSGLSLLGTAFAAFASAQFRALEIGIKVVPVMRTVSIVSGAAAMSGLVGLVLEETGVVPDTSIPEIAFLGGMLIYTFGVSYTTFFDQFRGVMMPVTGPGKVRDSRIVNQQLQQQFQYREQPFQRGSMTVQAQPRAEFKFVRFHTNNIPDANGKRAAEAGAWVVPRDEVSGLTPRQIQEKLALPYLPTHVSEVQTQHGDVISGIAAPNFGMQGGGVQIFLTTRGATFSNTRLLQGTFQ